jgi:hypothetical protein
MLLVCPRLLEAKFARYCVIGVDQRQDMDGLTKHCPAFIVAVGISWTAAPPEITLDMIRLTLTKMWNKHQQNTRVMRRSQVVRHLISGS